MSKSKILINTALVWLVFVGTIKAQTNYARLINPMIGTTGRWHFLDIGFACIAAGSPFAMALQKQLKKYPGTGLKKSSALRLLENY